MPICIVPVEMRVMLGAMIVSHFGQRPCLIAEKNYHLRQVPNCAGGKDDSYPGK